MPLAKLWSKVSLLFLSPTSLSVSTRIARGSVWRGQGPVWPLPPSATSQHSSWQRSSPSQRSEPFLYRYSEWGLYACVRVCESSVVWGLSLTNSPVPVFIGSRFLQTVVLLISFITLKVCTSVCVCVCAWGEVCVLLNPPLLLLWGCLVVGPVSVQIVAEVLVTESLCECVCASVYSHTLTSMCMCACGEL